jgi:LD-carboxypeptidase
MQAFHDPAIKGIIASIGGNDAVRLIPYVDLAVIRDNSKLFVGYSDPTVIHFGCLKAGLATLHGPTVMSGFAENAGMSPLSTASFYRAAFEARPIGELPDNTEGWTVEHLPWKDPANQDKPRRRTPSDGIKRLRGAGRARGHLIGGCAEVLEMLKATPWWPPLSYWDNAILFYETSEEAPPDGSVLSWLRNFAAHPLQTGGNPCRRVPAVRWTRRGAPPRRRQSCVRLMKQACKICQFLQTSILVTPTRLRHCPTELGQRLTATRRAFGYSKPLSGNDRRSTLTA